ncbi:MAG: radical SAM protein [Candidatus Nanoarchaeia archaeon]|jgi:radical SAM superfamily enzyme YgiQ (UPF0313 family)
MVDVLLINPHEDFYDVPKKKGFAIYPPMGLMYLSAVLKKNNISANIIDALAERINLNDLSDKIDKLNPKVIGITATTPQIRGAIQLAKSLKLKNKNIKICLGGAHISNDASFMNKFPYFDFCVVGEAETVFPNIVKDILSKKKIKKVYIGEAVSNLDNLPLPDWESINRNLYYIPNAKNFVTIHSSRGCPFNCSYCSKIKMPVRLRSPKNVIREINFYIKKYNIDYVLFTDDTFTLNKNRVKLLCEMMIKKQLKISWACETRADLVDKNILSLMKKAGCDEISFGVETGNEKLRFEVINKHIKNLQYLQAFKICNNLGIKTNAFFMMGFPKEDIPSLEDTLNFILELKPTIFGVHLTVLFPGSDIYKTALKEGKINENTWYKIFSGKINELPLYIPDHLSFEILNDFRRKIYKKFYLRPSFIIKRMFYSLTHHSVMADLSIFLDLLFKGKTKTGRP